MKNGATIALEASWALNILNPEKRPQHFAEQQQVLKFIPV